MDLRGKSWQTKRQELGKQKLDAMEWKENGCVWSGNEVDTCSFEAEKQSPCSWLCSSYCQWFRYRWCRIGVVELLEFYIQYNWEMNMGPLYNLEVKYKHSIIKFHIVSVL